MSSGAEEAIELAASAGLILDPWQQYGLEVMMGEDEHGDWACFEFAELVARQNGKGGIIEARELAGLFLLDEMLMLHSAHEFKTSKEAYLRIKGLIEGAPHLLSQVKYFHQSNEDTSIGLRNGARLRFMARSRTSGRGFSAQTLIVDEAQIGSSAAMGAILPTLSAQANPQVLYFGTVPRPEDDSEHFTSLRDRGREGGDPYLAWLEHNGGEKCDDLDDRRFWSMGNPALGYRLTERAIERERASMSDDDFARERLSIWAKLGAHTVVDFDRWSALYDPKPPKAEAVGLALDVVPDRSSASVAFAGRRPDGKRHVEVIENKRGTSWVVDLVVETLGDRDCAVLVDASGPAGSLIDPLEKAGVDVTAVSARDMAHACGDFYDGVMDDPTTITHFNQTVLNVALGAARKRTLGDAWAWHRKDATDISPLVSCTLALAALDETERADSKPKRSGKVW